MAAMAQQHLDEHHDATLSELVDESGYSSTQNSNAETLKRTRFDASTEEKRPATVSSTTRQSGNDSLPQTALSTERTSLDTDRDRDKGDKDQNLVYGAVEARWILMVLDDCMAKVSLLSHLTPEVLQDRIMETLDHQSFAVLKEHFSSENQWAQLVQQQIQHAQQQRTLEVDATLETVRLDELIANANEQTQKFYKELMSILSDSVRSVSRVLKHNPALVSRLKELNAKRSVACLEFINTFARLRKVMLNKLKMTAEDERAERDKLAELRAKEEEDQSKLRELTDHLSRKRLEHSKLIEEKDKKIEQLRGDIERLTVKTEQDRLEFERQMNVEADNAAKSFKLMEAKLQKELQDAQMQFEGDGAENFRKELANHRRQRNMAEDLEKRLSMYDTDMTEKHDAVVNLTDVYAKESAELKRLDKYFDEVDTENRRIAQELTDLAAARNKELEDHRKQHHAALLVQRLFNDHQAQLAAAEAKRIKKEKKDAREAKAAGVTVAQMERLKRLGMWQAPKKR